MPLPITAVNYQLSLALLQMSPEILHFATVTQHNAPKTYITARPSSHLLRIFSPKRVSVIWQSFSPGLLSLSPGDALGQITSNMLTPEIPNQTNYFHPVVVFVFIAAKAENQKGFDILKVAEIMVNGVPIAMETACNIT